jgi:predicted aldo/keto reductase-like oxidoreductase
MALRRIFQCLKCRTQFLVHVCRYNLNLCHPDVNIQFGWRLYALNCSFSLMDATAFAFRERMRCNRRIIILRFGDPEIVQTHPPIVYYVTAYE